MKYFRGYVYIVYQPVFIEKQAYFAGCAQTLPDANQPIGKIHLFSKIAITFKSIMQFLCPLKFRMALTCAT